MKRMLYIQFSLLLFIFGCSSDYDISEETGEVTISAKIVEAGGGPCAFLIQPIGDSPNFLFGEIPEEFQEDDLSVRLTYKSKNSVFSCSGFLKAAEIEIITLEENR